MNRPRPAPWQVWQADFDPHVGREQRGLRPAIIVGTPTACRAPNGLVIVLPTTHTNHRLTYQPAVHINGEPSWVLTDQIRAISEQRLQRRLSAGLSPEEIAEVKFALRQMIDLS